MENGKKISELPEITQLTGNEEIPVEVGGKNGRIKSGMFQTKGDYALKDEIPDTSNFITNTVNNLANYYLKQETYTKQEVVALINQITTINFKVVDALPDTGESNLIYLVKKEGSGDDVHDEYIWVEEKWEKIGSTTVDLTNYYTKTDADGRFALKTSIADMLTKTEAKNTYQSIGDYATKEELENVTPSIGENGNWIVGGKDTGKLSRGADGVSLGEIALEQTTGSNQNAVMSQAAVTEALNKKPAGGYNRSLFEAAGAVYNEETGFYELNGLTDITEEEMYNIYTYGKIPYLSNGDLRSFGIYTTVRTTIPYDILRLNKSVLTANAFSHNENLEVLCIDSTEFYLSNDYAGINGICNGCINLTAVKGVINAQNMINTSGLNILFQNCSKLQELKIRSIKVNVNIKYLQSINYESVKFMIDNATNTSAITITVHPTTYSYLTGTAEPTEQVGGTTEEWQALVTTAAEKQISFATE